MSREVTEALLDKIDELTEQNEVMRKALQDQLDYDGSMGPFGFYDLRKIARKALDSVTRVTPDEL